MEVVAIYCKIQQLQAAYSVIFQTADGYLLADFMYRKKVL
jgi:hypothetical protein